MRLVIEALGRDIDLFVGERADTYIFDDDKAAAYKREAVDGGNWRALALGQTLFTLETKHYA